jgi:glycosyltransferase involved in cell wall biosynthesis
MASRLSKTGAVPRERLHVVHNWSDGAAVAPVDHSRNPLHARWDLPGLFVVGYSGNLGRVHEFDTMLDAAARLRDASNVQFLVIGRGPRLREVQAEVEKRKLPNVRFESHQGREQLGQSLGAADVHLCVLQPAFESLVHPSKLYGIMAAGRPTIFVGSLGGEASRILGECDAGITVETGDGAGLAAAIIRLRDDTEMRTRMGQSARKAFEARYDMPIALRKWVEILGL